MAEWEFRTRFGWADSWGDWVAVEEYVEDIAGYADIEFRKKPPFSPGYFRKKSVGNQGPVEWWNVDPGVYYERVNVVRSLG